MDFFTIFALLGLVALARIVVGLGGMPKADLSSAAPCGAFDWAAVRAQILDSLGAEAVASRAQREEAAQRAVAKRQRRWVRRATLAEGRVQALSAAKASRLSARVAAKAAARAKSAAVAERYGHAAQRAAAAVRAARKAALATGAVPCEGYGIKARKRAERGSTVAANAQKRAAVLAVAQQRNAAARAAADAANAAFAAEQAVKAAAQATRTAWADLRREALGYRPEVLWTAAAAKAALAEARAAAREAREAKLAEAKALAAVTWEQSQAALAVLRLERKARAKAELLQWLEAGNGQPSKTAAARLASLVKEAELAHMAFWVETGIDPEVAADRGAVRAARETVRAARQGKAVAA